MDRVSNFVIGGCGVVMSLSQVGPLDLALDLREHTYCFRFGFFLRPKTVKGPFVDIARLRLDGGSQEAGQAKPYKITLEWRGALSPPRPILGEFGKKTRDARAAKILMQQVAAKIGVTCVYPPFFKISCPEGTE